MPQWEPAALPQPPPGQDHTTMVILLWGAFILVVLGMLALDLGVLNRTPHVVSTKESLRWTILWVAVSLIFTVGVYFLYEHHILGIGREIGHQINGWQAAMEFLTGYIVEKSLSLDNIFVIAMIFEYFAVPAMYQHRVLYWGIMGALVLRGAMILAGTALVHRFTWMIYVFGALLIITGIRMLLSRDVKVEPEKNPLVRLARRLYPVSSGFEGQKFFTRVVGRRGITPLFLVLLVIESTDVLFAVDSIPAIFAITRDPFIVFTSNVFAILGLRALYFVLASVMDRFRYMKLSLVIVLLYVGVKMLVSHHYPIPTGISLAVVCGVLTTGMAASALVSRRERRRQLRAADDPAAKVVDGTWKQVRRMVVLVIGATVLLIGLAGTVLPFVPAVVIIPAGLAILATEFLWARRLLQKVKKNALDLKDGLLGNPRDPPA